MDGEKIDYIEDTDDEVKLIRDLLKPAKVDKIEITEKKVYVDMAEDQKALAIGKGAANVKLASKISGHTIEIR